MDWISLIQVAAGMVSGVGIAAFTKSGRVKAKSDAYAAMAKAYDDRIAALHSIVDNNNKTEIEHSRRISDLNRALDSKTERIRKLTDDVFDSQQELNRANERITQLTGELADRRMETERLGRIRCLRYDCGDRLPPELAEKLRNMPREDGADGQK